MENLRRQSAGNEHASPPITEANLHHRSVVLSFGVSRQIEGCILSSTLEPAVSGTLGPDRISYEAPASEKKPQPRQVMLRPETEHWLEI